MFLGSRNSSGKRPNLEKFLTLSSSQNECRAFSNHPNDLRTLHDSPGQLKQNPTMTIPYTQTSWTITPERQRNPVSSFRIGGLETYATHRIACQASTHVDSGKCCGSKSVNPAIPKVSSTLLVEWLLWFEFGGILESDKKCRTPKILTDSKIKQQVEMEFLKNKGNLLDNHWIFLIQTTNSPKLVTSSLSNPRLRLAKHR